MEQFTGLR